MTRKTKRSLKKKVEDLANDTSPGGDSDPPTKAELGITADFIDFSDNSHGSDSETEASFIAFKEAHVDSEEGDR